MTNTLLDKYERDPTHLLMILHDFHRQSSHNYVTIENMSAIADYLNIPYSWVHGVATYYSMFSVTPRGRFVIRVCKSPICHLEGSGRVLEKLQEILEIGVGGTTGDGMFSIEHTECLGRCAVAPTIMVNEEIFDAATVEKLESIVESFRER